MSTPIPAARVVCVVYHPGPELTRFAAGLRAASSRDVELVLVDNGDDHTVAQASRSPGMDCLVSHPSFAHSKVWV